MQDRDTRTSEGDKVKHLSDITEAHGNFRL